MSLKLMKFLLIFQTPLNGCRNADDHQLMITKGAVEEMEEVCTHAQINGEIVPLSTAVREELRRVNVQMNKQGMRVLAVAVKRCP